MRLLALFDGPAAAEAIRALRRAPIPGLSDVLSGLDEDEWEAALDDLRELRLLTEANEERPGELDCHPMVRAYFAKQLQRDEPKAWQNGHLCLYKHFKKKENISVIDNLYLAIHHGCKAGHHATVFDELVWKEMSAAFALKRVNAHGAGARDEIILRYFVSNSADSELRCDLEGFDGERKGRLFLWAAVVLHVLGRVSAAVKAARSARKVFQPNPDRLGYWCASAYLSWFLAASGKLNEAVELAESCVRGVEEDLQDEPIWKQIVLCLHGCMLSYRGEFDEALEQYKKAMIQKCATPNDYEIVFAILRFHYACLLLKRNSYEEAGHEAEYLKTMGQDDPTLGFLGYQILARMELAKASEKIAEGPYGKPEKPSLGKAKQYLDHGKDCLNHCPAHDQTIVNALFMAQFYRKRGKLKEAVNYLEQAEEAVGPFALLEIDCCLERAWLFLARGDTEKAGEKCKTVRGLVNKYDYRCIEEELSELEKELKKA